MRASLVAVLLGICLVPPALVADGPFRTGGPATTDNDASCDIALLPAATLLLPYFEVDLGAEPGRGETTIFTITNVTNRPQIAHVTLWSDLAYPVIDFSIYLTGYDVQSVNLYDVIAEGLIAPDDGTGSDVSPVGELSGTSQTQDFDNPLAIEASCVDLPVQFPQRFIDLMQQAFTAGRTVAGLQRQPCERIGGVHTNAIGYATVDVVNACTTTLPTELRYYTSEILFDNVLIGDYLQFNGEARAAQGGPMVHIRAIPEGGTARDRRDNPAYRVNSERTFYSRYQHASQPKLDARQPLPSVFAARFISGSPLRTYLKIWREGRETGTACSAYQRNLMNLREVVRFDEEENPSTTAPDILICAPVPSTAPILPATSMVEVDGPVFILDGNYHENGWLYLNMDYCDRDDFAGQNWIVSSMRSANYAVDIPAIALGNGCTAPVAVTEATSGYSALGAPLPIGPAPNIRP